MGIDLYAINNPASGTVTKSDTSRRTLGDIACPAPRLKDPTDIPNDGTVPGWGDGGAARKRHEHLSALGKKGATTLAARKEIKEIADDPSFDASLAGTRARIEKAVALTSIVVLRHAEDGSVAADHFDQLSKLASTMRSLDATTPLDPAKLTDEQLVDAAK